MCRYTFDIWDEVGSHDLLPSFPGSVFDIVSLRKHSSSSQFTGAEEGRFCNKRFLESTVKSLVEKVKQCKSPEEMERVIEDVRSSTDRLNEVSIVLLHSPVPDVFRSVCK